MKNSLRPLALGLAAAVIGLSGCNRGHGTWTEGGTIIGKQRVAQLKSANEYQMAKQNFLAGDLEKALKGIDKSLTINPSVAISHVLRGRVLIEMDSLEEAHNALSSAETLDPQNVEAQYYLGILAERISDREEALKRYQAAASMDPAEPQYTIAAAECMMDLERFDEAEAFLNGQKSTLSHNAGIRQTLGHVALLKGEHEKAMELFNEARLLAPEDSAIVEDLVRAQISCAKFAEAEYNLARLCKMDENAARRDLLSLRARCLIEVDRPMEAREILIGLTTGDAGASDVDAWVQFGQLSYMLKDANRLKQASGRVIALAPQRHEGYMLRGLWFKRRGELTSALGEFDKAIERRGASADPFILRGLTLETLGQFGEARLAYNQALAASPSDQTVARLISTLDARQAVATVPEDGN